MEQKKWDISLSDRRNRNLWWIYMVRILLLSYWKYLSLILIEKGCLR